MRIQIGRAVVCEENKKMGIDAAGRSNVYVYLQIPVKFFNFTNIYI